MSSYGRAPSRPSVSGSGMDTEMTLMPPRYGGPVLSLVGQGPGESLLPTAPGFERQAETWGAVRVFGWTLFTLFCAAVVAMVITNFVLTLVWNSQIKDELHNAKKHITALGVALAACCNASATNIALLNETLTNEITTIGDTITIIEGNITTLDECCTNNTAANDALADELFDLEQEVSFVEGDIDVLQQNVGDLQLQIDAL
jgi:hypothetical protein